MIKKYSVLFLLGISFLVMLPTCNKMWAPYDEGNYLNTAFMVLNGLIPYRDFLLAMYPPGQAYTLAMLLKIFGLNIFVGRIYNIILLSAICALVYSITKKVTSQKYALLAFTVCLSVLSSLGEPPIPRPIWPGVMFSLVATLYLLDFIEKEKIRYLILSGFFLAVTAFYRHDIAFLTSVSGLMGIFSYLAYGFQNKTGARAFVIKNAVKLLFIYLIFKLIFICVFIAWLYKVKALNDAFNAVFVLPATFHKWARIPFPPFCFDFGMIFHRGCLFIKNNKYYIPILLALGSAILFFAELSSKRKLDKRLVSLIVIIVLGIAYLQQLVFRTDDNHLAVAFPPSAILFGALFTYAHNHRRKFFGILKKIFIFYISLLVILLVYHSMERYIKEIYTKPFIKMETEPVTFKQGTIYIPDDVRDTFVTLAKYIEENTAPGERIYIGSLKHNVPQMGWFELLYFLTERLPGVKYYVMIPGFQTIPDIQEEMVESLKRNKVRVVLLRDYGETDILGPLDRYIRKVYKLDKIIDSYYIYVKK